MSDCKECRIFESLSKFGINFSDHNINSLECTDKCPDYGKCFYEGTNVPNNFCLGNDYSGWCKCFQYTMTKSCMYNKYIVRHIIHLMHPCRISDILIMRCLKKSNKSNAYNIRYVVKQHGGKEHVCIDLVDLNKYIRNYMQYYGRDITYSDFCNKEKGE